MIKRKAETPAKRLCHNPVVTPARFGAASLAPKGPDAKIFEILELIFVTFLMRPGS